MGAKAGLVDGGGHRDGVAVLRKNLSWNWISIPPVDNYSGTTRDYNKLYNILNQNMGNDFLEIGENNYHLITDISWQFNTNIGSFYWNEQQNMYSYTNINHETRSQYGYKLVLNDNAADKEFLQYGGIIPAGYQAVYPGNPVNTICI